MLKKRVNKHIEFLHEESQLDQYHQIRTANGSKSEAVETNDKLKSGRVCSVWTEHLFNESAFAVQPHIETLQNLFGFWTSGTHISSILKFWVDHNKFQTHGRGAKTHDDYLKVAKLDKQLPNTEFVGSFQNANNCQQQQGHRAIAKHLNNEENHAERQHLKLNNSIYSRDFGSKARCKGKSIGMPSRK
eukprot:7051055-Heterocapsa_arctica.AAC.1